MTIMRNQGTSSAMPYLLAAIVLTVLASPAPLRAEMNDYCVVPPYVVQNIQPNVMLVVDTSGSMFNFAYADGFQTTSTLDDLGCAPAGGPCTGFTNPGVYPDYKYYGYFDPDSWYMYSTSGGKFVVSRLKAAGAKNSTEWDGSFLNWVTMRRVDVLRKVLTGGKKEPAKDRASTGSKGKSRTAIPGGPSSSSTPTVTPHIPVIKRSRSATQVRVAAGAAEGRFHRSPSAVKRGRSTFGWSCRLRSREFCRTWSGRGPASE